MGFFTKNSVVEDDGGAAEVRALQDELSALRQEASRKEAEEAELAADKARAEAEQAREREANNRLKRKVEQREREDEELFKKAKYETRMDMLAYTVKHNIKTGIDHTSLLSAFLRTQDAVTELVHYLEDSGPIDKSAVYGIAAKVMQLMEKTNKLH